MCKHACGKIRRMNDSNAWIPDRFLEEMKEILGDEYRSFLDSYKDEYLRGVRCNTLKISPADFEKKIPFIERRVSWTSDGFYTHEEEQPSKHPFYYAGLYYIQEPSAMLPAALLPVDPGDRVLDLCAAPGGKTTELGAKLKGKGILVSNDISVSRAKALLKNIELFGIRNAVVVSEPPDKLAERFEGYFNKILVDAPCSGEGMFRKVHSIAKNWEQYGSEYYAQIQRSILPSAVKMLAPGGFMLYSTCTFSKLEDEDSLKYILENFPDMELVSAIDFEDERYHGFAKGMDGMDRAIRIYPHRVKGEGHFAALLRKKSSLKDEDTFKQESGIIEEAPDSYPGEDPILYKNSYDSSIRKKFKKISNEAFDFFEKLGFKIEPDRLLVKENRIFLMPGERPDIQGLRVLRAGLLMGEMKTGRFEPSQALALALKNGEYRSRVNLPVNDDRVIRYLKCESITLGDEECGENTAKDGYCLIETEGFSLGWGKNDKGRIKNKYLASWRLQ